MLVLLLGITGYAQSLVENAAAAAGGSVGGVAGKKVGEGLAGIFNKVDKTTAKAAKTRVSKAQLSDASDELMEVGPGVPRSAPSVPPPPPIHRAVVRKVARTPAPVPITPVVLAAPPPPPPQVTGDDLNKISTGMKRDALLQLGPPAVRITMFEDGHLLEIYRYMANETIVGVVRLIDGNVAAVQMP
ncbi:MAG TPA: hypothetical protein VKX39_13900 [Bryobacteraceae bacterium]|nr:hypothetical protein [Bryobacteraceae bacterium]